VKEVEIKKEAEKPKKRETKALKK